MLEGLNREAGVRPALSRNCNGEQSRICPLGRPEKAWPSDDPKPGELPVLTSVKTCDAQGGYICTVYLMENSTVAFLLYFAAWRLCILVRGDDVF